MSDEVRELTDREFARAMPRKQRERILRGKLAGGEDVIGPRSRTSNRVVTAAAVYRNDLCATCPQGLQRFEGAGDILGLVKTGNNDRERHENR